MSKKALAAPLLILAVGGGWILHTHDILPPVEWIRTLSLAAAGALVFLLGGMNQLTFAVGPFLLASAGFSGLRKTGLLEWKHEVPYLVTLIGLLWLAGLAMRLPNPDWDHEEGNPR